MKNITIYKDIYSMDAPYYVTVNEALERIRNGNSRAQIERIRQTLDHDKADAMKKQLPAVCFSGKFAKGRKDEGLLQHSGFLILDFDYLGQEELREKQIEFISLPYTYACWISPRGNGLKVLVRIADGKKHREHFEALKELFPKVDNSGINESRVCFESYDPEIFINTNAVPFTSIKVIEYVQINNQVREEFEIFKRLLTWLTNRNDAFVKGSRNLFIYKLAAACCRFGLSEQGAVNMIMAEFPSSNDFTQKECMTTVRSAFRSNRAEAGTASFENDKLVEKTTRMEVKIDTTMFNDERPKDVIYGEDVKEMAVAIYKKGYQQVAGINVPEVDRRFKLKRTEITLLSGIGNYGKSAYLKWLLLMRVLLYGERFAIFSPEENPAEEFYHDLVEILLGQDCTPGNPGRPSMEVYSNAYDFISRHIFYVYPDSESPTPEYVLERFLELIIKEKVDGVVVDPFNQLTNNYAAFGGKIDQYLELMLSLFKRFAIQNHIFFIIVAHPNKMQKGTDGNYPCPDVFDLAGGAMWNNKMDNILIYHRPFRQMNPDDETCEHHSKKIKKQKTVGLPGFETFMLKRDIRRFIFPSGDPMSQVISNKKITFKHQQATLL